MLKKLRFAKSVLMILNCDNTTTPHIAYHERIKDIDMIITLFMKK